MYRRFVHRLGLQAIAGEIRIAERLLCESLPQRTKADEELVLYTLDIAIAGTSQPWLEAGVDC